MQYFKLRCIYSINKYTRKKFTHNLFVPRLNFNFNTEGEISPNKGSAWENRALVFYFYLQCFSINASAFGSPNSLALAKLAHASFFFFI